MSNIMQGVMIKSKSILCDDMMNVLGFCSKAGRSRAMWLVTMFGVNSGSKMLDRN